MKTTSRIAVVIGTIILTLAGPSVSPRAGQAWMEIFRAAEKMLNQQQPDQALAELQKVFSQTDEFAPAYFLAGMVYAAKDDTLKFYENMVKAAEYDPAMGIAHRMASQGSAAMGNMAASWEHAIKAHQAGTDMSDAFAALSSMGEAPDGLEAAMVAPRVWIGPFDTSVWEEQGDSALQGGASSAGSSLTNRAARIMEEAAPDIERWEKAAKVAFAESRVFGLVARREQAEYMLQLEVDSMADSAPRRTRGYLKLFVVQSGEEAYRGRVTFADIGSDGDLIRDFDRILSIMEEWVAEQLR